MHIIKEEYLEDYAMRRKKFVYDRRIHHSYIFIVGNEIYTVIIGSLTDKNIFIRAGYAMPEGVSFPANGMAEVYFDTFDGMDSLGDFRHVHFAGLGSAVVLQSVSLALIAHFEAFNIGGFVFQAASGGMVDLNRKISLEEIYDYMLGLKNEPRYNPLTGLPKKTPRPLLPKELHAWKLLSKGKACYVVLQ